MLLEDVFTRFNIVLLTDKKRVAYVLASFDCLRESEDIEHDIAVASDIEYYTEQELNNLIVKESAFTSGCYVSGRFLSLENVVGAITEFEAY